MRQSTAKLGAPKRARTFKLNFHALPTNKQKHRFGHHFTDECCTCAPEYGKGVDYSDPDRRWGPTEDVVHMLKCTLSKETAEPLWQAFETALQTAGTPKSIHNIIVGAMQRWSRNESPINLRNYNDIDQMVVKQALLDQRDITWDQLFHGRVAATWQQAVKTEAQRHDGRPDVPRWTAKFVKAINDLGLSTWKLRCKQLHGATRQSAIERKRTDLLVRATELWNHRHMVDGCCQAHLRRGVHRHTWTWTHLRQWVHKAEIMLEAGLRAPAVVDGMRQLTAMWVRVEQR